MTLSQRRKKQQPKKMRGKVVSCLTKKLLKKRGGEGDKTGWEKWGKVVSGTQIKAEWRAAVWRESAPPPHALSSIKARHHKGCTHTRVHPYACAPICALSSIKARHQGETSRRDIINPKTRQSSICKQNWRNETLYKSAKTWATCCTV